MACADLFVAGLTPRVRVHAVVQLSVLEHYMRRTYGTTTVVGTLLGSLTGTHVEVTNCFPDKITVVDGVVRKGGRRCPVSCVSRSLTHSHSLSHTPSLPYTHSHTRTHAR